MAVVSRPTADRDDADPSALCLRRWQEHGDRDALDELLRIEIAILRERLRRRGAAALSPELSSSDFAQQSVVGLLNVRETPQFDGPQALRAYLWRSALRLLAAHSERASHGQASLDAAASQGLASALATTGGFGAVEADERTAALELALALLEPHEREALSLVYFEGLSVQAAGARLGIGEEAAKKRVARARRRLAEKLGRWAELIG
jgi:RNA polymerase sigma factor (sigma-70 family)